MHRIIDTNVPIVANGNESPQASDECKLMCVKALKRLFQGEDKLVIDDAWHIIGEYQHKLYPDRGIGLGDAFIQWVLTYWTTELCLQLPITPVANSFVEFPDDPRLVDFDLADRKWIAVAISARHILGKSAPISQAVDDKWRRFSDALSDAGVAIDFICDQPMTPVKQKRKRKANKRSTAR